MVFFSFSSASANNFSLSPLSSDASRRICLLYTSYCIFVQFYHVFSRGVQSKTAHGTAQIAAPRQAVGKYAPKIIQIQIDPAKIGDVVGQRGKTINAIIEETGVKIDITAVSYTHLVRLSKPVCLCSHALIIA